MPAARFSKARIAVAALPALALFVACSSSTSGTKAEAAGDDWAGEQRDTEIKHEVCDTKGKEVRTFKGESDLSSGKSYVTRVYAGSREVCSFSDLNGDGNVDLYTYFDDAGRIRRREAAYTVSKQIDEIAVYKNGELVVVMRETNFDGKLDTWDYYEAGKLVRRERDKTADGRIDEWWQFEPGTDNATIVQANVTTGKPDPSSAVKLGVGSATFAAMPKPAATAPDAGAETTTALPPVEPPPAAPAADAGAKADSGATTDAGKKGAK